VAARVVALSAEVDAAALGWAANDSHDRAVLSENYDEIPSGLDDGDRSAIPPQPITLVAGDALGDGAPSHVMLLVGFSENKRERFQAHATLLDARHCMVREGNLVRCADPHVGPSLMCRPLI